MKSLVTILVVVMKNGCRHTPKISGDRSPLKNIFVHNVVKLSIFMEMDADEDVVRVHTCKRWNVMIFDFTTPGTTPPPPS